MIHQSQLTETLQKLSLPEIRNINIGFLRDNQKINEEIENEYPKEKLSQQDKNKIWNFCLLNASTNRSYGNAIFPVKRQTIIEKDQGINKEQKDDNQTDKKQTSKKNVIAFVPPVTKNVFLKYYTKSNVQFR